MDKQKQLELAIKIAVEWHEGQRDEGQICYYLHLFRVMLKMETAEEMTVAVLHDIIEDTGCRLSHLRKYGLSEKIVQAIELLTHTEDDGLTYAEYVDKLKDNKLARAVKFADLEDNLSPHRYEPELLEKHKYWNDKHLTAWIKLLEYERR